jgi:hypothetical protein
MHSILNLNKKLQDKKLKEFQEKAQKCAKEIDDVCIKYELKIVPFIQLNSLGESPLISGMKAQYTFAPMNQTEIESIKLKQKQDEAKNTELDIEKTD